MKKLFKKDSIIATAVNVGIGGVANVGIDYAWEQIEALQQYDEYKNIGKIVLGAVVGSMASGKYARFIRAAADGVAVVGVSDLVQGYIDKTPNITTGNSGLPRGTVDGLGRIRYGKRGFGKSGKIAGDFIAAD